MSSEERLAILKMLSEGRISVDEAEKLLRAISGESAAGPERHRRGEWAEEIGAEVRRAVRSVQASEIGRMIGEEVKRAIGSVRRKEVGHWVGEIAAQVKEVVAGMAAGAGHRQATEESEWNLDGIGVTRLQAETTSGQIKLKGGDGNQIWVRAFKRVQAPSEEEARAFAQEVEAFAVREGDAVRVYKEHPPLPKGVKVEVGYEIECPRAIDVELRTVNGNLHCREIDGEVRAQSTNGNVRVSRCRGRIEVRTQNGNGVAFLEELRQEGIFTSCNGNVSVSLRSGQAQLTATTTNGNVEVAVPGDFAGRLDAKTTNGGVYSDLKLTQVDQQKRNLLVGQVGAGGQAEIRAYTLNGNVWLKRIQEEE